jgi:hypothetical protein
MNQEDYKNKKRILNLKEKLNNLITNSIVISLNKPNKIKYFCIGYPKTGTTTLAECFKILKYKEIKLYDYFIKWFQSNKNINDILNDKYFLKEIKENRMFADWPFHLIYKEIYKKFPNSKFILTIRKDKKTWEESLARYKKRKIKKTMLWKGLPPNQYEKHIREVKEHFKNSPNNLLIMCFEKGDEWEKLCTFLKEEVPNTKFPHKNKGELWKLNEK